MPVPDRQVALIRGINVGRAKRVAMADLRAVVEGLGYTDVRTLLNSGNIVFTDSGTGGQGATPRIEEGIRQEFGLSVRVTVLTAAEVAAVVHDHPLEAFVTDPARLFVAVLTNPQDRSKLDPLQEQDWGSEVLAIGARVAYLWCPEGLMASRLPEAVGRLLGDAVTTRNWGTVTKLHVLMTQ